MFEISVPWRKVLVIGLIVGIILGWRLLTWGSPVQEIGPELEAPGTEIRTATAAPPAKDQAQVTVHVVGPVHRPGVVTLPAGSRVADALAAAGGVLPEAQPLTINLARVVVDGEQIDPHAHAGAASGQATSAGQLIDLNTADAEQFDELPGVGPVLADRIVSYREDVGRFESVDQLQEVPGIGLARMTELRDLVSVTP